MNTKEETLEKLRKKTLDEDVFLEELTLKTKGLLKHEISATLLSYYI